MTCTITELGVSSGGGSIEGIFGDPLFVIPQISSIAGTSAGSVVADTAGRILYTTIGTNLVAIDISAPETPVQIASTVLSPFTVQVRGKYLIAILPFQNQIIFYDITEPKLIVQTAVLNTTGLVYAATFYGEYLVVATLLSGIFIYDISDLSNVVQISNLTGVSGTPGAACTLGTNIFFRTNAGTFYSIDVSNVFAPSIQATLSIGGTIAPLKMDRNERYVFTSGNESLNQLAVIDVGNPASISANLITLPSAPLSTVINGGRLLLFVGNDNNIYGYDIQDITTPLLAFGAEAAALYASISGNIIVATTKSGEPDLIRVFQVTDLEFISMSVGAAEFGNVNVRNTLRAFQDFSVTGSSTFGAKAIFQDDVGVSGRLLPKGGIEENTRILTTTPQTQIDSDVYVQYNNSAASNFYLQSADSDLTRFEVGHKITITKSNANAFSIGIDAGGGSHVFTGFITAAKNFTVTLPSNRTFLPADVNTGTEEITIVGHGYRTGDRCTISTTGTRPSPLTTATYYIINISANLIKLATTQANAYAGTAINLTTQGTGTHTVNITGTDKADCAGHGYSGNEFGLVSTTVTLPSGLVSTTSYYINVFDANTIRFVTTLSGTAYTYMTTSGSGTQTFTPNQLNGLLASTQTYQLGQKVRVSTSVSLPSPLATATDYFVIPISNYLTGTFKLASSLSNARAGTAITITTTGSGTNVIQGRETINGVFPSTNPTAGIGSINLVQPYASITLRRSGDETWVTE